MAITVAQGPLSLLYNQYEIPYSDGLKKFDIQKPIKRWYDPGAADRADEEYPDPVTGEATVEYLTYVADNKSNSVKPRKFRLTVSAALTYNIPHPNDTQNKFPQEIPVPCRLIDPSQETFAIGVAGVILVRNIELWNKQQFSDERTGYTATDRAILNLILTKLSNLEAKLQSLK